MKKGMGEREINLWDLFWAVCCKWRSILVCAVLFAILAGVFSFSQEIKKQKEMEKQEESVSVESLAEELTYDEKKAADLYLDYVPVYYEQNLYNENSPIMNLDANGFYKGEVSYYVDNHYEVQYPYISKKDNSAVLVNAYKNGINSIAFREKVAAVLDVTDESYITEVIDAEMTYGDENTISNDEDAGLLTVYVYSADENICLELMGLVKEAIEDEGTFVTKRFGEHNLSLLQENCSFTNDSDIITYQKSNVDKLSSIIYNMDNWKKDFNDQQLAYVDECIKELTGEKVPENEEEEESHSSYLLIAVGLFGGALVMFFVWACGYIFDAKVRLEDDYEKIFSLRLIGSVPISEEKKRWFSFVDRFLAKMRHYNKRYFEKEEAIDMIASNLRMVLKNKNLQKVVFTGAVCGDDEKQVAEAIANKLKKDGIEIVFEKPALYNADSLEHLVEEGCVVLVEKVNKTLYQEIANEIELCECQNVCMLGCVLVY